MTTTNRRLEPRHRVNKLPIEITLDGRKQEGILVNVSRAAACLNDVSFMDSQGVPHTKTYLPEKTGKILIKPFSHEIIERDCKILRIGEGPIPTCVIEFEGGLTSPDINAIAMHAPEADDYKLDMAKEDQQAVRDELLSIQECRSHVFVGTIASLGAAAVAVGMAIANAPVHQDAGWVLAGACVAAFLLLIGILATVEKARAINLRRGFLAALANYLRLGQAPPSYCSWSNLQHLQNSCGQRRESGECTQMKRYEKQKKEYDIARTKYVQDSKNRPPGPEPLRRETCWTLGAFEQESTNSHRELVPGVFDSFMSFSGVVYCISYGLVSMVLVGSLFVIFFERNLANWLTLSGCIAGGMMMGPFLVYYSPKITHKKKSNNSDRTEPVRKLVRWISCAGVLIIIVLTTIGLCMYVPTNVASLVASTAIALATAWVSGLAVFLVYQLAKVRKGLYSVGSMCSAWRHVFLECQHEHPLRDREALDKEYKASERKGSLF